MGCCMSRSQSGSTSPYPGPTNTGSARAINASTSAAAHDRDDSPAASTTQASSRGRRHRQSTLPLDRHINKPLRRHVWASKSRVWTRSAINRERKDFFETRVTGRPEIWQSLHYALQVLWDPASHGAAEDGTNGLATAQSILDAADITLPTGDLAQGAYDQLGNYYQLNEWAVANPTNLVEDDATIDVADDDEGLSTRDFKDDLAGGEETTEELDEDENLSLLARLSENGRDVTVGFSKTDTVKIITGKILNEAGLSPTKKKIRLAFMGKLLKENLPLTEQGWTQGQVINAYVSDR
ncbi:Ubiquitin domain-containing protein 2 [Colletotrichum siamense]|uniref:Ubiquitin domain-containing protein 2 n=1 Tax=Colletotrichum siamense TaxID=690259 RepID=A0A9P5K951_COLSI|nr:Ubiquitin domain-containing protein 2 [Colletotrichum siamense]KAF4856296.1 Ubiquitin domain-containing protein 2 [Colletotrichum siamense]KAF4866193.1 Ubiquitin domain-containing protein 2 [Colletotrichum siamense]KAF4868370.1 Ubiquitin domain-containing protein 2 [Colletotrichum siamense]